MSFRSGSRCVGLGSSRSHAVCAFLALALWTTSGCRPAPELSEESFRVAQTLFNVCNSENTEQLTRLDDLIQQSRDKGTISARESQLFNSVIEQAQQGNWDRARQLTKNLLSRQTRPNR